MPSALGILVSRGFLAALSFALALTPVALKVVLDARRRRHRLTHLAHHAGLALGNLLHSRSERLLPSIIARASRDVPACGGVAPRFHGATYWISASASTRSRKCGLKKPAVLRSTFRPRISDNSISIP